MNFFSKTLQFESGDKEYIPFRVPSTAENFFRSPLNGVGRNIFWSRYEPKNFGDWIGPYLFFKMTGLAPNFQRCSHSTQTIFTAGSIFRHIRNSGSAIIWGSGVISSSDRFEAPREILAVRGRKTYEILKDRGFDCPTVFGDPGIILPRYFRPESPSKKFALGVIPHFCELDSVLALQETCTGKDILIIDPTQPIEKVISQIVSCEMTISSSLHGLIVSHAYGVPSGWGRFSPPSQGKIDGDGIKFYDYFSSFDCNIENLCLLILKPIESEMGRIKAHIKRTPLPDLEPLADKLIAACPF